MDTLVELHAVDPGAAGLADFGKPQGYVQRQVDGWTERYARARTDDVPDMERLAGWLAAHLPRGRGPARSSTTTSSTTTWCSTRPT